MMTIKQEIYLTICMIEHCYKLIGIDLSRQTDKSIPQQIIFVAELENDGATMFSITEK